jgi:hypothetical protein
MAGLTAVLAVGVWLLAMPGRCPGGPSPARIPLADVARRARLVPICCFDSLALIGPGAWSPQGYRLARYRSTSALYVLDAARPDAAPRVVLRNGGSIQSFSWSPDGRWLAEVVGDPRSEQETAIVAVAATGGTPVVLTRGTDIRPVAWGSDGRIYCWTGRRRHALEPRAAWKPHATLRLADPPLVEVAEGLSLRLRHWVPQPGEEPLLPGADLKSTNGTRVRVLGLLPDGSRVLVGVSRDTTARWLIVDRDGRTGTDLGRSGLRFLSASLSGDGRLVAGFMGRWQREDGWTGTALRIADARRRLGGTDRRIGRGHRPAALARRHAGRFHRQRQRCQAHRAARVRTALNAPPS